MFVSNQKLARHIQSLKLSLPVRLRGTGHTRAWPRCCPAPLPSAAPPGRKCAKSTRQAGSPCQPAGGNSRAQATAPLTTWVYFAQLSQLRLKLIRFAQQVHREGTRIRQGGRRGALPTPVNQSRLAEVDINEDQ